MSERRNTMRRVIKSCQCICATLAQDRRLESGQDMLSASKIGRMAARAAIRVYQLTISSLTGSQCRHLPTCSAYMDEAIARHGLWAGGFMGLARLCRCQPFGTAGFDPVPLDLPARAYWLRPWSYGRWRGRLPEFEHDFIAGAALPERSVQSGGLVKESSVGEAKCDDRQGDGAGVGDIEALNRTDHVEASDDITVLARETAQPLAFATKHERERAR